jgi:hypothetical protein
MSSSIMFSSVMFPILATREVCTTPMTNVFYFLHDGAKVTNSFEFK